MFPNLNIHNKETWPTFWMNFHSAKVVTKHIVNTTIWGSNKYKVPLMGKAKLARREKLLDSLPLTPTRSLNMANVYSTVEICKRNFLVGHKLGLIRRVLVRQREY